LFYSTRDEMIPILLSSCVHSLLGVIGSRAEKKANKYVSNDIVWQMFCWAPLFNCQKAFKAELLQHCHDINKTRTF
jgi:hypothetical protein